MLIPEHENLPFTLTVLDVANLLGINKNLAYKLVSSNEFPSIRIGKRLLIPSNAFIRWVDNTSNRQL